MLTSMHSGGRPKTKAESLVARVGRIPWIAFTSGWANHIETARDGKSRAWITSLVEYLKEGNLSILRHGNIMLSSDVPVVDHWYWMTSNVVCCGPEV